MASQQGYRTWSITKNNNVWISGREVGTADNLLANIVHLQTATSGGVPTGLGFFHQATRASPKAPSQAGVFREFPLEFNPQLDEDTKRHIEAVFGAANYGSAGIWFPYPLVVDWKISTGRTKYTLPCTITGSAPTTGLLWPAIYHQPIVEIRGASPGEAGILDSTLTFVASSPSSTEFTLASTVENTDFITTGDLSAKVGSVLTAFVWAIWEVQISDLEQGFDEPGQWLQSLNLRMAPSPKDYEAD